MTPIDVQIGKTGYVGKLPSIALWFRVAPLWHAALGYLPGDLERPDDAPPDWTPKASGEPDEALANAIALLLVARSLPSVFPLVRDMREDRRARVLEIHDVVFDQIYALGLTFPEIERVYAQGVEIATKLTTAIGRIEEARKEARGNSEAPKGGSSTRPG